MNGLHGSSGLFEERAVLMGKLGRHEQALSIFTDILDDVPAAIEYCDAWHRSDTPSSHEVYFYLLKLLLQPHQAARIPGLAYPATDIQRQPDVATALNILDRFPSRIDPIKVRNLMKLTALLPRRVGRVFRSFFIQDDRFSEESMLLKREVCQWALLLT